MTADEIRRRKAVRLIMDACQIEGVHAHEIKTNSDRKKGWT